MLDRSINEPTVDGKDPLEICFSELKIVGDASVQEDFAAGSICLWNRSEASIQAEGIGPGLGGPSAPVAFSANLVCEILVDENDRAHVPGP